MRFVFLNFWLLELLMKYVYYDISVEYLLKKFIVVFSKSIRVLNWQKMMSNF